MVSGRRARVIARAPIAAGAIVGRRRRPVSGGADFVVPFAAIGLAALDRRGMSAGAGRDEALADSGDRLSRVRRAAEAVRAGEVPDATARTREEVVRVG